MKTILNEFLKKILSISVLIFSLLSSPAQANDIYAGDFIYMIKNGDTIEEIANKFNVTPSAIYNANLINNKNQFTEGMRLIIPTSKERYKAEISECRGTFYPDFGIHIIVNWDSNLISVNGVSLKISDVSIDRIGSGITTTPYINKLGISVYYLISKVNPPFHGDFVVQISGITGGIIDTAPLACTKSFDRPFVKRMLNA